jgi:GDP-mannose 6-dehydrogenase
MNVSVIGLGYVGCVSIGCLANSGHTVIGVDVDKNKVNLVNNAKPTIVEKDIDILIYKNKENISATTDILESVTKSDISIICVGTPNKEDGLLNLDYVENVAKNIGLALKEKDTFHVVSIRSTVSPNTNKRVGKIIEKYSSKRRGIDFDVVSNPEFLREGSAVKDYYNPQVTVVGVNQEESKASDMMKELYSDIKDEFMLTSIESAEIIKYINNSWHAVKITFANEVGNICKILGIDAYEVMDIFCKDTKLNLSPYYLKPGFAYGGSCLPKDLKGFVSLAKSLDISTPLLNSIEDSNNYQIGIAYNHIKQYKKKKIALLGVSFKSGTDDVRLSPNLALVKLLEKDELEVIIHDKEVYSSIKNKVNESFIQSELGTLKDKITDDLEVVINNSELIILGNNEPYYDNLNLLLTAEHIFYELSKYKGNISCSKEGVCWK